MPVLNENLVFHRDAPAGDRRAFVGGTARRRLLVAGTRLFKFTSHDVHSRNRHDAISPWWIAVDPLDASELGLDGMISQARELGQSILDYARERHAVMFEWNAMTGIQGVFVRAPVIRLRESVYGFHGRCQRMTNDRIPLSARSRKVIAASSRPAASPTLLRGGGSQLWIPNLRYEQWALAAFHMLPR